MIVIFVFFFSRDYRELIRTKPSKDLLEKVKFPKLVQDEDGSALAKFREFVQQVQDAAAIMSHSEGADWCSVAILSQKYRRYATIWTVLSRVFGSPIDGCE